MISNCYSINIDKENLYNDFLEIYNKSPIIKDILSVTATYAYISSDTPLSISFVGKEFDPAAPTNTGGYHFSYYNRGYHFSYYNRLVIFSENDGFNFYYLIH